MRILTVCGLAMLIARLATPCSMVMAKRIGAMDVPRDWRRMHRQSIPRAGGVAILTGFIVAMTVLNPGSDFLIQAVLGGLCMGAVGLIDDVYCLTPKSKLFLQLAVALIATRDVGGVGRLVGVLWLLVTVNAHNMIDGLDGLLGGCAALEGSFLGLALMLSGLREAGVAAWIVALACVGFLPYNRHPARTFAGDCGSEALGFLLGMLALPLLLGEGGGVLPLCPLFLLAYPLTELSVTVLRRSLRGVSPFAADRAHLHHRLCAAGLDQPHCVGILLTLTALSGILGVLLRDLTHPGMAAAICLLAALVLILLRRYVLSFSGD